MNSNKQKILSKIPQIDQILNHPQLQPFIDKFSHDFILCCVQHETRRLRERLLSESISNGLSRPGILDEIVEKSVEYINQKLQPSLKKAINATGIILHTGLGRAPLMEEARDNLMQITEGYCTLEIDLESGKRGERIEHIEKLLGNLTGAEAACVVNNNAAAVLLTLNTLCFGKEAIISRGQLIEIGGSFRIPEVIEKSGTKMIEVGTTNKTHLHDYERVISENTRLLFAVHPSNYRVKGFTKEVKINDLVDLGKKYNLAVAQDLGGGVLVDLRKYKLPYEPVVRDSIEAGVDVVTFSGDKVLGGPQSGIIVGRKKYLDAIKSNPLMRALRCGKLTYAILEPTLKLYLREKEFIKHNRVLNMLLEPLDSLEKRVEKIKKKITDDIKSNCEINFEDTTVQIGSGALPLEELPSIAITLRMANVPTEILAKKFRLHEPPIFGYIRENRLFFDIRTVFKKDEKLLISAMQKIIGNNC
ncbi:MAG: L-seryl-tRNA(Sec) selenium transferase [bacterium]